MHIPTTKTLIMLFSVAVSTVTASNLYFQPESTSSYVYYDESALNCGEIANYDTSLALGNCNCNNIPSSWPTVCVHFHMKGQAVTMYSGSGCTGTNLGE